MSLSRPRALSGAWLVLVVVTVASTYTAEYASWHLFAVAAIMGIAALKGSLILWRFMDVGIAPVGIRAYMMAWIVGCAVMIFAGYWIASG